MDICSAILKINPTAQVSVNAEDFDQITWHADTPVIPKADIEAMIVEMKADYDAREYQRKRQPEYPSIPDQLDDLYHNGVAGWKTTIKVTKDKHPKG